MSDVPNLFDVAAAIAARDAAIARHDTTALWMKAARFCIMDRAQECETFTSDDVWQSLAEIGFGAPPEPRALGHAMKAAMTAGTITPTDTYALSERPDAHRRPVRVWRSNIYGGAE